MAADIMMAFPFATYRRLRRLDLEPHPALRDRVARIEARPAFQVSVVPVRR